jgi:hypothetical protein
MTLTLCSKSDYEDESLHKSIMLYGWDTFDFVEYQIRRLFKISPKCKSRLWINIQENGCDTIFENLGELSGPVITKVSHHLPWMSKLLCARGKQILLKNPFPYDLTLYVGHFHPLLRGMLMKWDVLLLLYFFPHQSFSSSTMDV